MQKLGKTFPNYLQKFALISKTEFHGHKNLLIRQHKFARVSPCPLKYGLSEAFEVPSQL